MFNVTGLPFWFIEMRMLSFYVDSERRLCSITVATTGLRTLEIFVHFTVVATTFFTTLAFGAHYVFESLAAFLYNKSCTANSEMLRISSVYLRWVCRRLRARTTECS